MQESKKDEMADKPSSEDTDYIRIICEALRITPAEAVTLALKEKAHALTCRHSHQQYEPPRH